MVSGYFFQKFVLNVQCLQFLVSAIRSAAQPALLLEFVACFEDLDRNAPRGTADGNRLAVPKRVQYAWNVRYGWDAVLAGDNGAGLL